MCLVGSSGRPVPGRAPDESNPVNVERSANHAAPRTTATATQAPPAAAPTAPRTPLPTIASTVSTIQRPAIEPADPASTMTASVRPSPAPTPGPPARRSATSSAAPPTVMPTEVPIASALSVAGPSRPSGTRTLHATTDATTTVNHPRLVARTAARPRSSAYSDRDTWKTSPSPSRPGATQVSAGPIDATNVRSPSTIARNTPTTPGTAATSAAAPPALATRTARVVTAAICAYPSRSPAAARPASRGNVLVASGTASTAYGSR